MAEETVKVLVQSVLGTAIRAAKEEISYIRNYDESVDKLRGQADSLRFINRKLERQIGNAIKEGHDLIDGLQEKVNEAKGEMSIVENFLVEQGNLTKKNWCNLYRYGKTAVSKLSSLERLAKRLDEMSSGVSVPTPAPRTLDLIERKNFSGIRTQEKSLEDIIKAVKDERIQIIGIYGPGGVGKTTLAHEVAVRVKDHFADIVLITVSENVDVERLRDSVKTAARRIQKKEKILIILDDVWKELDICRRLGIPCGDDHMNCKILLTSRSKKVCEAMKAGKTILIESLPKEDALSLFKNVVGKKLDDDKSKQIAEEVVEICGGLPLIIEVVGKVFHKQRTNLWEETLSQLKNHSPSVIQQEIREKFTLLRLSYDHLESEEAKFCFLLSSMFPEDEFIPLERLAYYGVSLGKFNRLRSIKDARDRVQIAVDTLKSSSLLLNGKDKFTTKMHDVVREVAHLIASKGNNNFLVEAGVGLAEWIPRKNGQSDYTGISLMRNDIREVPNYLLHFPDLNTFLIQENHNLSEISEEFIEGIKEAKVLDMEHNNISTLPNSMKLLVKLRLLNLGGNSSLKDISILGELEQLEILILNDTSIKEIPQEIGKLENLRRLEVKRCYNLCHIAPGVISKLRWLEELCIGYYPVRKESCSTFEDLKKLSKLVYLYLFVTDYDLIPPGVHLGRVEEFVIIIGKNEIDFDLPREHSKHLLVLGRFFS